jgi:hypothetical protein
MYEAASATLINRVLMMWERKSLRKIYGSTNENDSWRMKIKSRNL